MVGRFNKQRPGWIKGGIAGLLMAGWVYYIQPQTLWTTWHQVDVRYLLLGAGLGLVGLAIQWGKWYLLIGGEDPYITPWRALESILIGFALGMVSPGRLGELARGLFLGGNQTRWVVLAGIDRGTSFGVTLVAGWCVALWLMPWSVGLAGVGAAAGICWFLSRSRAGLQRLGGGLSRRVWGRLLCWSALFNGLFFLQFYCLLHAWVTPGLEVGITIPLIFALKGLLPISFMDLGIREGVAVALLEPVGIVPAVAFNAAFSLGLINLLLPGLLGAVLLVKHLPEHTTVFHWLQAAKKSIVSGADLERNKGATGGKIPLNTSPDRALIKGEL